MNIIKIAQESIDNAKKERLVELAKYRLNQINILEAQIASLEDKINTYQEELEAIDTGKYVEKNDEYATMGLAPAHFSSAGVATPAYTSSNSAAIRLR